MKAKMVYILFLVFLVLTSASAREEKAKIQLVYREQADGQWQVSVFGTVCEDMMKMRLVEPEQPVIQPFVVQCYHPAKER